MALCLPAARASPGSARTLAHLHAYASAHDLAVRVVEAGPSDRSVLRYFVPVEDPAQWRSFQEHFAAPHGVIVRHLYDEHRHNRLIVEPGSWYAWGRNLQTTGESVAGYSVVIALRPAELAHAQAWLAARKGEAFGDNCIRFIPNLEVAPGVTLFEAVGVRRSKDGPNGKAKLLWSANARVQVIGVHRGSAAAGRAGAHETTVPPAFERFEELSDWDLLGPAPAGGVDDSAVSSSPPHSHG